MSAAGLIFSNIHDTNLRELTSQRTIASVPFGCRYRLIDFTLSNMVNSDVHNVQIITHYNYRSLMDHIGSGKDWDLARRNGGIKILPPYITAFDNHRNSLYSTRLEALKSMHSAIRKIRDEYVIMSDCDVICNVDFGEILTDHIQSGADMTVAVKRMHLTPERARINVLFTADADGRITEILPYPENFLGEADVSLNIVVMRKDYLEQIVLDSIAHGYSSLTRDVIGRNLSRMNYRIYKYDGYFACISSLTDYYKCNMELIHNAYARASLFDVNNRPIYTKVRNSVPTYYSRSSAVENSLIADGCVIEGRVENSILFRGVKIGRGCTVTNSILMQDTVVGDGAFLKCVISDKNGMIRDGQMLAGCEAKPYYIEKGKML